MNIYWIMLICFLTQIGFSGSRVGMALFGLELGANPATIGVLVSLFSLCPTLLSIAIGKYADRVPTRLPMIVGVAGLGVTLLMPAIFHSVIALCASAFVLGFAHQLFLIPMEATVGGVGGAENRARNYSFISMAHAAANAVGPITAGFSIDYLGHANAFLVLASFAVVPLILLWRKAHLFPVKAHHAADRKQERVFDLWRMPHLRATFIASGIVGSAQDLFQFFLPIYGRSVGLSASAIGLILGMVSVASFVIRSVIPFVIKKWTEAQILTFSIFVAASAFLVLPLFENPYALAAIAFFLGLGVGCAQPMAMSLVYVLCPKGRIAEATGLRKTVNNLTHLLVPLVFGSVGATFGFSTVFISNALMLATGGVLMRRARVPGHLPTKG